MRALLFAGTLAVRDLRGSLARFRVFLLCLGLGVAVIAGVGSLRSAIEAGIRDQGGALLGGDVAVRSHGHDLDQATRDWLRRNAAGVSAVATFRGMAEANGRQTLVEVKAVDAAYPLYGTLLAEPSRPLADLLAPANGVGGAVVEAGVFARLGIGIGDRLRIGDATIVITALLKAEPDRATNPFVLGPRVLIAWDTLLATGLVQPGSQVMFVYRARLDDGVAAGPWLSALQAAFPQATWETTQLADARPGVQRFVDRLGFFLELVGLTALLIGGIGVGVSVSGHLDAKLRTIAILRSVGATAGQVFGLCLAQVGLVAAVGTAAGLIIGALTPATVAGLLAEAVPVAGATLYPLALLRAAAFGLLTALLFALWPLFRVRRVPGALLFRDLVVPVAAAPTATEALLLVALGGLVAAFAVVGAVNRPIAIWFVVGAAGALFIFAGAARLLQRAARLLPPLPRPDLRLGVANLHRPGAPTVPVLTALGVGLTVLVTVFQVEHNLTRHLESQLPTAAPSLYVLDIQAAQADDFDALALTLPGVEDLVRVPILRGRLHTANGVPIQTIDASPQAEWVKRREVAFSYLARMPLDAELRAGRWWPIDYAGPPIVSLDARVAEGFGIKVGDRISLLLMGREIAAEVANLRRIEWGSFGLNFVVIFAPGALEAAPQTHVASLRVAAGTEDAASAAITAAFPSASVIPVREALDTVRQVLGRVINAVRASAAVTLVSGLMVLIGAVAAGHQRRLYDAVVLKVLGATRGDLARAYVVEFGLIGSIAAALAGVIGTLAARGLVAQVSGVGWDLEPARILVTVATAAGVAIAAGFLGAWRVLGERPAAHLRHP
ncbi:MAG: FtsX-like permease family protein [Alphaproteobacteria bacterium]|nr:FtsX-like permease family protein [Alphaproteobacteria bacterium]